MAYVVKAAIRSEPEAEVLSFTEKTMYGGKKIRAGDEIFVFSSDHQGGRGLIARGVVTAAARLPGIWISIEVRLVARARRALGRNELKPFRELNDGQPMTELARKFYRQATNKIGGISDEAAALLMTYF
ncbi:MAG TPA: hypothetical protein VKS60_23570 [Stellaceae bacterium]|nr:hypothetical protein [Stellaceae bacterium]